MPSASVVQVSELNLDLEMRDEKMGNTYRCLRYRRRGVRGSCLRVLLALMDLGGCVLNIL